MWRWWGYGWERAGPAAARAPLGGHTIVAPSRAISPDRSTSIPSMPPFVLPHTAAHPSLSMPYRRYSIGRYTLPPATRSVHIAVHTVQATAAAAQEVHATASALPLAVLLHVLPRVADLLPSSFPKIVRAVHVESTTTIVISHYSSHHLHLRQLHAAPGTPRSFWCSTICKSRSLSHTRCVPEVICRIRNH